MGYFKKAIIFGIGACIGYGVYRTIADMISGQTFEYLYSKHTEPNDSSECDCAFKTDKCNINKRCEFLNKSDEGMELNVSEDQIDEKLKVLKDASKRLEEDSELLAKSIAKLKTKFENILNTTAEEMRGKINMVKDEVMNSTDEMSNSEDNTAENIDINEEFSVEDSKSKELDDSNIETAEDSEDNDIIDDSTQDEIESEEKAIEDHGTEMEVDSLDKEKVTEIFGNDSNK